MPAISVCGAEEWLGEWTFALPQGSMTDEPIYWADLLAERGHTEVGVLVEGSLIGESYARNFRKACARTASASWRRSASRRPRRTSATRCAGSATRKATAIVHCGFGFGLVQVNPVLAGARLGPAAVHGHRVRERVDQPGDVARHRRLDRPRPVRRGQPGRSGVPRPVRGGDRPAAASTACRW